MAELATIAKSHRLLAGHVVCGGPENGRSGSTNQGSLLGRTLPSFTAANQGIVRSLCGTVPRCQRATESQQKAHLQLDGRTIGRRSQRVVQRSAVAASGKYYVLQPDSKKATGYFPPFSKDLLDNLLVEMPPHLLQELREIVQNRISSESVDAATAAEDERLFESVVQMMGEYDRNLLYQLPGETLEEVQSFLAKRGRILYIADSKIEGAGRGGFAKVPIKAGTVITQYINERQLLNAPMGLVRSTNLAGALGEESDSEASVSGSENGQKYDYYGREVDWPPHAIPHLLNDHSALRGPDLYVDPALKMAQYLRRLVTMNNVAFVERWGERFAVATRDIEAGEELLWTYGISWWLDVERENMFMVMLWIASEQTGSEMGGKEREMIEEAWSRIRVLEEAAQAGKAMELEVVGKHGPKAREEVYVMEPLPKLFENEEILREQLVPYYADMLEAWKRDTFDEEMLQEMQRTMFG